MRLGHARGLACAKPKNFLAFFSRLLPPPLRREAEKYGKEIFGFASPFQSPKRASLCYHVWIALFSALTATEAHPYPRLVVALTSANRTQPPSHSPLAFARAGCFGVVRVRSVASLENGGNSNTKWIVRDTNKSVCACPTHPVRAQARPLRGRLPLNLI
jgi:hypothetical protein